LTKFELYDTAFQRYLKVEIGLANNENKYDESKQKYQHDRNISGELVNDKSESFAKLDDSSKNDSPILLMLSKKKQKQNI